MAKMTFANQDQVTIHKERYDSNFLQVSIDEWTTAFATLKPGTFGLYTKLLKSILTAVSGNKALVAVQAHSSRYGQSHLSLTA